ncbi:MAG: right-handed parallel beta-helix repeat-containing protein [Verrucomicrobiota bacterium]
MKRFDNASPPHELLVKAHTLYPALVPLLLSVVLTTCSPSGVHLYVSQDGNAKNKGTLTSPLDFATALERTRDVIRNEGLPAGGVTIHILGGHYYFDQPFILGSDLKGTADHPIRIQAAKNQNVIFDGSQRIAAEDFSPVTDAAEKARLAKNSAEKIFVTTLKDQALTTKLSGSIMLNLIINGREYLPATFPNQGYAMLKAETVTPEISPPAVPAGKQNYGIRAGHPPYLESGKPQGWKGTLNDPRGARVGIDTVKYAMAGTWSQWELELERNNTRNTLTGFIEANWLLSSQPVVAASAKEQCIHLSQALSYGWAWRKHDKPFRLFGLLCELDTPGEWHFDTLTNQLFLYPPGELSTKTEISLATATGFIEINGATHVSIIGLNVQYVGSGSVFKITGGEQNLIAGCKISNSTATGVEIRGKYNSLKGCDLVDLNHHVSLRGGTRSPEEITPGGNRIENCHFYQKNFRHQKVNISMKGVGNYFSNNLVHNSLGQALTVTGNDQVIEQNEFFNVGYDEGDGGAVYAGADLTGYGTLYRHNFFHHLMHVPGKVERSGIHLDDRQAGATCIGNIFYKSAAKGIHMNGGAGHVLRDNVFLEGFRGIYNVGAGARKSYQRQLGALSDPEHMYRNTKENYVGRAEKIVGPRGWENSLWKDKYPLFHQVMSDEGEYGRMWPIHCTVDNNFYFGNTRSNFTEWSRVEEAAMQKVSITNDREITPDIFIDYHALDLRFKPSTNGMPEIPFSDIGLKLDAYRNEMPDKNHYRTTIKAFFEGIGSMPGTHKKIDTAQLVEEGPLIRH